MPIVGSLILPDFMVPSRNKSLDSSSNHHLHAPHKIGYPNGWRTGDTEEWYKSQPTTKFTHLQYRKERDSPFYHEFIILELDNDTVCRFDRRGDVRTRTGAFAFKVRIAEDTAQVIHKHEAHYADIEKNSDMLLRINFPNGQDLLTVLAVCYGVQKDYKARAFTLTRYNCYFLCWVIIVTIARRTVDWTVLSKDTSDWEELVRTTIESSNAKQLGTNNRVKRGVLVGRGREGATVRVPEIVRSLPPASTAYLTGTLRQALFSTRPSIQKSLDQLILHSTVESAMRRASLEMTKKVTGAAARTYASQAARDAAMEAVIESTWGKRLVSGEMGQLWEDTCKATEVAVWKAAAAAADAAEDDQVPENGPMQWESAWDKAWSDSWKEPLADQSLKDFKDSSIGQVSMRAKEAWIEAKAEACTANLEYVSLFSDAVVDYVLRNLPDSSPETLKVDMAAPKPEFHALFASMNLESNNLKLQEYIQSQIKDLCQRARSVGFIRTPDDIEEAMRRVWVETIKTLDSAPTSNT
ncbi:hypothetical protein FRC12_021156 [Ceratobasidium sp. 428]|nr:hypothetical protein FRC12_021156 [Ceratobasidium sp. 428]